MTTTRPDLPSDEVRDAARRRAYDMRRAALTALTDQETTWQQIVTLSTRPRGEPLRKLKLRDLAYIALTNDGVSPQSINRRWAMFRRLVGHPDPNKIRDSTFTIGWLLNNASAPGARLAAWCDAMAPTHAQRQIRVAGFPWHLSSELERAWLGPKVSDAP